MANNNKHVQLTADELDGTSHETDVIVWFAVKAGVKLDALPKAPTDARRPKATLAPLLQGMVMTVDSRRGTFRGEDDHGKGGGLQDRRLPLPRGDVVSLKKAIIVKKGPPKGKRPLCMYCGKELTPRYHDEWESDGAAHWDVTYDQEREREAKGDRRVRRWDGCWNGFPKQKGQFVGEQPTHCNAQCASWHGVSLARLLISSAGHAVKLTDIGIHRAEHARKSYLDVAAESLIATTPDPDEE